MLSGVGGLCSFLLCKVRPGILMERQFRIFRIPKELKTLTEEQRAEVNLLLDKINEDEDVTNVYHNMEEPEEAE